MSSLKGGVLKYCCLDTGLDGALLFCEQGSPSDAVRFSREGRGLKLGPIIYKLKEWKPDKIFMEGILIKPGQSSKSLATQWLVFGQCQTLAQIYCEELEIVPAVRWTNFSKRLTSDMNRPNKECMQELADKFFSDFCEPFRLRKYKGVRKIHDGIADTLGLHAYVERDNFLDFIDQ